MALLAFLVVWDLPLDDMHKLGYLDSDLGHSLSFTCHLYPFSLLTCHTFSYLPRIPTTPIPPSHRFRQFILAPLLFFLDPPLGACIHAWGETVRVTMSLARYVNTKNDPLEVIGEDLMIRVFGKLDALSLCLSLIVSRSWFSISSSNLLWSPLCEELWVGKAHIPRRSRLPGLSKLASYSRALADSKRDCITREDLCDHAWNFNFTETAPEYWRNIDPYWTGEGPLKRRYFHPDGSISADPEDKTWGGHESTYTVVTSVTVDGGITRENYVRINRWPRMRVTRRDDWGWELSNVIVHYSSIPDAHKEGGTGPML